MFDNIMGTAQRLIGQTRLGTRLALKMRNQCDAVIGYRCGAGVIQARANGEEWLAALVAPEASTFVDVGANVGDWTAMFLSHTRRPSRGLLCEPNPDAVQVLRTRFAKLEGVQVAEIAASDEAGTASFYVEGGCGETSSLVAQHSQAGARPTHVVTATLDGELRRRGISHVDMLKIDAEGSDLKVLQGARQMLKAKAIDVVQFEYNAPWAAAGSTLQFAFSMLRGFGYEVFLLQNGRMCIIEPREVGEYFRYSNFVAYCPGKFYDRMSALDKVVFM